ncbi:MAG: hypothetical protein K6B44_02445 [Lachnospiraceae bacterium]|nr:hypothetical protein [Lachnospiraceae bacterium]
MAYFDSPKNKAIWKKELEGLRAERARREENGFRPETVEKAEVQKSADRPGRRRINLEQLEAIEREAGGIRRVRRPVRERSKTMEKQAVNQAEKSGRTM